MEAVGGQLEEPHLQIINIVFQSNPNTRQDLRPGYEKKAGRLSVPKFFFLFFSSAKLSTCERTREVSGGGVVGEGGQ